jgi:hypothetical protein
LAFSGDEVKFAESFFEILELKLSFGPVVVCFLVDDVGFGELFKVCEGLSVACS